MTTSPATDLDLDAVPDVVTRAEAVRAEIADAAAFLASTWPLADFIAVNPLFGLLDRPFTEAATHAGDLLGARATRTRPGCGPRGSAAGSPTTTCALR